MRNLVITDEYIEIEYFLTSRNSFKIKRLTVNEIREISNEMFATRREFNHMLFVRAKNGQLYSGSYAGRFKAVSACLREFAYLNGIAFEIRNGYGLGRIAIAVAVVIYAIGMLLSDILRK